MTNNKIFIFDIDDCILPSIFPKLLTEDQTEEEKQEIVDYINKKGLKTKLFSNFVKFFEKYCEGKENTTISFITGRKRSYFEDLTLHQLKILYSDFILIFYPEDGIYTQEYYTNWKLKSIINILKENTYEKCFVFDDDSSYFIPLLIKYPDCMVCEVNNDKIWRNLRLI